jgi:hypothetical protein
MFQIEGRDLLFAWLAKETDPERRLRMLEWMAAFSKDPLAGAERVSNIAAPCTSCRCRYAHR